MARERGGGGRINTIGKIKTQGEVIIFVIKKLPLYKKSRKPRYI